MNFCAQMDKSWKMFLKIERKYINKIQKFYFVFNMKNVNFGYKN